MTIIPPEPGAPRRPDGPRDPGDAWVEAPDGTKYWGRFGAAGLLALDAQRGALLQHRVPWSHHGGTWGLPGGARHEGESAVHAALRESAEEAGVPADSIRPRFVSVFDLGYWSYATVVGDVTEPFEAEITDPESVALEWVPMDEVTGRELHPGFAHAFEELREMSKFKPAVVVDVANVMGSVPDGWWRDRAGAAAKILTQVSGLAERGVPGSALGLPGAVWFPEWVAVIEGQAKAAKDVAGVTVVRAKGEGDDTIVAEAKRLVGAGYEVSVVTRDRGLIARVEKVGATVRNIRWLRDMFA